MRNENPQKWFSRKFLKLLKEKNYESRFEAWCKFLKGGAGGKL
tara:strand:+ start:126 stop:254 length:129 start_codon:yes stop_codon:yes gene_type:complete